MGGLSCLRWLSGGLFSSLTHKQREHHTGTIPEAGQKRGGRLRRGLHASAPQGGVGGTADELCPFCMLHGQIQGVAWGVLNHLYHDIQRVILSLIWRLGSASAFIKVPGSQSHRVWLHSPGMQPGCLQFFKIPPVILMLRWIKKHSVTFWEGGSAEPQERAWWVGGTVAWSEPGGWTEGGRQGRSLRLGQTPILKSSGKLRKG